MIEQIWKKPEIYRIPVPLPDNPLKTLNSYVICSSDKSLIIDTGFKRAECREKLWEGINELNLDLSKTALFLTHLHSDHTGLVWDFVEKGIPVYMGISEYNYLAFLSKENSSHALYERYAKEGYPKEQLERQTTENHGIIYAPNSDFPVIGLEDKDCIDFGEFKAQVILTPGHTPGHMVVYLPDFELLFTGDHVLFDITPNISVWPFVNSSLSDYLASLSYIQTLPVKKAFPAHRSFEGQLSERIEAIKKHHENRIQEILSAIKEYPGSDAFQIAGHISWSMRGLAWKDFPQNQKWFAMSETLAHLDYMVEKKMILKKEEINITYTDTSHPISQRTLPVRR